MEGTTLIMGYAPRQEKLKPKSTNNNPLAIRDITAMKDISSPVSIKPRDMSPKNISLVSKTSINTPVLDITEEAFKAVYHTKHYYSITANKPEFAVTITNREDGTVTGFSTTEEFKQFKQQWKANYKLRMAESTKEQVPIMSDPNGVIYDGGILDIVEITIIKPRDNYEQAILDNRIIFTENYGWVDNTHAFTDTKRNESYIGVEKLWSQLKNVASPDQIHMGYYSVNYKQDIILGKFSIGVERQYLVKQGLNLDERKSVALAIFQDVSMAFEQFQGMHPTSGSSFEPADLPSNMLSFYRTVEGISESEIKEMIKPVLPEQAIEVYRSYQGTFTKRKYKNRSFTPRYFNTPYTSSSFGVPDRLNTIKPASISSMKDFGKAKLILIEQDFIRKRNKKK